MDTALNPILLSVKPRFADLIFNGLKEAELRRRFIQNAKDRDVFVYVTSPVRTLRGGFRVGHVWHGTPANIWNEVHHMAQVKKREFDEYYGDCSVVYALRITDVWEYNKPMNFQTLKRQLSEFVVPQSWRYVRPEECVFFKNAKRKERLRLTNTA